MLLAKAFEEFGTKWNKITETYFPNKTALLIKNRYYAYIKRKDLLPNLLEEVKIYEAKHGPIQGACGLKVDKSVKNLVPKKSFIKPPKNSSSGSKEFSEIFQ